MFNKRPVIWLMQTDRQTDSHTPILEMLSHLKIEYERTLNSNRKMGYEHMLKPKVSLRILTSQNVILYTVSFSFSPITMYSYFL